MRALISGYDLMQCIDKHKEGLLLHYVYYAVADDETSLRASERFVDARSPLYDLIMSTDLSQPVWADLTFGLRDGYIGAEIADIVFDGVGAATFVG